MGENGRGGKRARGKTTEEEEEDEAGRRKSEEGLVAFVASNYFGLWTKASKKKRTTRDTNRGLDWEEGKTSVVA